MALRKVLGHWSSVRSRRRSLRNPQSAIRNRKGVILLVAMALLALFSVVVLTFVIVAQQHKQSADAMLKGKFYDDNYEEHLGQAALQLMVGTDNPLSVIGPHSLLEDLYGNGLDGQGSISGTITAVTAVTNNQLFVLSPSPAPTERLRGYYSGQVITIYKGGRAESYRVVDYGAPEPYTDTNGNGYRDAMEAYTDINGNSEHDLYTTHLTVATNGEYTPNQFMQLYPLPEGFIDLDGDNVWDSGETYTDTDGNGQYDNRDPEFVLNGRAFAGPGFGFDPGDAIDFRPVATRIPGLGTPRDSRTFNNLVGDDDLLDYAPDHLLNYPVATRPIALGPIALLPNPRDPQYQRYLRRQYFDGTTWITTAPAAPNGTDMPFPFPIANEDYDAADYQNMLLAFAIATRHGPDLQPGVAGVDDDSANGVDDEGETGFAGSDDGPIPVLIPSLHRPELVQHWYEQIEVWLQTPLPNPTNTRNDRWNVIHRVWGPDGIRGTGDDPLSLADGDRVVALKRRFILRPLQEDHPNFSGSNPASLLSATPSPAVIPATSTGAVEPYWYLGTDGAWDIDNDGDGQADSIWVDLGMPVQTTPDGRQYKPLFAVYVVDMDGKLNINIHGQLNDWNNDAPETGTTLSRNPGGQLTTLNRPANTGPSNTPEMAGTAPLSSRQARLPVGQGYGPHEVSLTPTMSPAYDVLVSSSDIVPLLRGYYDTSAAQRFEGRYGEVHLLPNTAYSTNDVAILPGQTTIDDNAPASAPTYGSPTDFDANGVLGLGPDGQPRFKYLGTTNGTNAVAEGTDEPFELDPTRRRKHGTPAGLLANTDNSFSPEEFEALLRRNDLDAPLLPQRLSNLAPSLFTPYNAARVTTQSYDIPAPSFTPTPEIQYGLQVYSRMNNAQPVNYGSLSILDLIRGKLIAANDDDFDPAPPAMGQTADAVLIDGEPYIDQNGNGAYDSMDTYTDINNNMQWDVGYIPTLIAQDVIAPELLSGHRFNLNRPFDPANELYDKTRFARHLTFMLMLLKDYDYSITVNTTTNTSSATGTSPNRLESTGAAERMDMTIRQIAQWAVNVVEFRDDDFRMMPFEYVLDPFEYDPTAMRPFRGWSVDDVLTTNEAALPPADPNHNPDRRLLWGCEEPVLLLTESIGLHDRRVEDLPVGGMRADANSDMMYDDAVPGGGTQGMGGYDQRRMPQGSAFFELYCTRNPNNTQTASTDLFTGTGALDLGKMQGNNPVWRLAISESRLADTDNDVPRRVRDRPFSTSLEPDVFNHVLPTEPAVTIDRIVWFAAPPAMQDPQTTMHADRDLVYYNRAAAGSNVHVPAGQYVVVGPSRTVVGMPRQNNNVTVLGWTTGAPGPQEIQLTPTFHVTDNAGTPVGTAYPSAHTKPVIGIAVGGDRTPYDAGWTLGPVGISVSEPLFSGNYYPGIAGPMGINQTTYPQNGGMVVNDVYDPPLDAPLDDTRVLGTESILDTGTTPNYRTVFLQRLADPTQAFHATLNPYITVDWLPIDLTVFNGQSTPPLDDNNAMTFEANDPRDPRRGTQAVTSADAVRFGTRQRGYPRSLSLADETVPNYNLWSAVSEAQDPPVAVSSAATTFTSLLNLEHTLGYINAPFHDQTLPGPWKFNGNTNPYGASYHGSPSKPYPWLTWPNSPYISQFQLMQVPASSPARLGWEFTLSDMSQGFYQEQTDERKDRNYERNSGGTTPDYNYAPVASTPYGHLLNFFYSSQNDSVWDTANATANGHAESVPNYYRLFDYVEVPSQFPGTRTPIDSTVFRAPYNQLPTELPTFRTPGLVNLNTLGDLEQRAWLGVTNSFNSVDTTHPLTTLPYASGNATWTAVRGSRQGYPGTGYLTLDNSADFLPTRFAKPFRSLGGSNYVPTDALRIANGIELIESTFLRRTADGVNNPLFGFLSRTDSFTDADGDGVWDMGETLTDDRNSNMQYDEYDNTGLGANVPIRGHFNNSDNNPYFRYLMYQKLGNILTTRSNVYAVWITMGYFEVERVAIDAGNPDGYALGAELGSDTGEIKRHKSFFMIDRSIPVAFSRGQNYNVQRAVLLHRLVE